MERNVYLSKFNRCIREFTEVSGSNLLEDDPNGGMNQAQQDPNMGGAPMGGDPGMGGAPMGGDPGMGGAPMGGDPGIGGAPMGGDPGMGGAPMGGDPGMGGAPNGAPGFDPQGGQDPNMGGAPADGSMPQGADMGGAPTGGEQGGEMSPVEQDNETKEALKSVEDKLEKFAGKFEELCKSVSAVSKRAEENAAMFDKLQQDMEKRNPTPEEKMSLRSTKSAPYAETPTEYWEDKDADPNSNYSSEDDRNGEDMQKYKITKAEIDNLNDWRGISKSFDDERKTMGLRDILGY